jgi:hypothetical protein
LKTNSFFDFQNFIKIETAGSLIFKFSKNGKTETVSFKKKNKELDNIGI